MTRHPAVHRPEPLDRWPQVRRVDLREAFWFLAVAFLFIAITATR